VTIGLRVLARYSAAAKRVVTPAWTA
jgi:hypothetical protein